MNTSDHDHLRNPQGLSQGEHRGAQLDGSGLSRPLKSALMMVALVGGFYLLREHWDHVAGNWIYLLLLACPLMLLFHGHGGHGGHPKLPTTPVDKEE
jgi:hypothetical protein